MAFLLGIILLAVAAAAGGKDFEQGHQTFCDDTPSRTGYLPAGRGAQYFYWLTDTRRNDSAPLVLWMTGGPGCSSILAMVTENGPCLVKKGNASEAWKMQRNPWSWTEVGTVLWVDQPGEVGFSIGAESDDELGVSERMLVFMLAFYERYPSLLKAPLFLAGESYAGHYIPAVATELLVAWDRGAQLAKVRGIAMGNALVSPAPQFASKPMMAFTGGKQEGGSVGGVVSEAVFKAMTARLPGCLDSILRCRRLPGAQVSPSCEMAYHVCLQSELLLEMRCGRNVYDVRQACHEQNVVDCFDFSAPRAFLNDAKVQKALGVPSGLAWKPCNMQVESEFVRSGDYMSSTDGLVAELLERGIAVLAYSGDTDLVVDWLGTRDWMERLEWRGQAKWASVPLKPFKVHNRTVGRQKSYDGFTFLQIFESGHLVPKDQPEVALRMLRKFVSLDSDWVAAPPTVFKGGPKGMGLSAMAPEKVQDSSKVMGLLAEAADKAQDNKIVLGTVSLLGAACAAFLACMLRFGSHRQEPDAQYSLMT